MTQEMDYFEDMEAIIPRGRVRTRFAPSPTGYMHIGNLRTALYTYLIARRYGGTFILRIEDTDKKREVAGATEIIYSTLRECGLTPDEGPLEGGPVGPYIQSERRDTYGRYAERLVERGHAYYCFCSKHDAEDAGDPDADAVHVSALDPTPTVHTPCACRDLDPAVARARAAKGEPFVIRQKIPSDGTASFHDAIYGHVTVPCDSLDDQVLLKSDGLPTYNFANVIDDHLMGITHVVRGSEYLASAPKYSLLYEGFGWEAPEYVHCPPVMRDKHQKMSKRHGDPSYEDLRHEGFLTEAILNYVALLGWSPRGGEAEREFFTLSELIDSFDESAIAKSPAIFDIEKLRYFNAAYIRAMSDEEFMEQAEPYIAAALPHTYVNINAALLAPLLKPRLETFLEIAPQIDFIDALPEYDTELYVHKKSKTDRDSSLGTLELLKPLLDGLSDWNADTIRTLLTETAEREGVKNAFIMWPLRIAISGRAVTPGGASEIAAILGRDETLRRVEIGIKKLKQVENLTN